MLDRILVIMVILMMFVNLATISVIRETLRDLAWTSDRTSKLLKVTQIVLLVVMITIIVLSFCWGLAIYLIV